ncbi:hypothetical protein C7447_11015 [Tenacibaculum adriaticum]|uniref:Uncharacterized protein n=1 Tax=Tenacibaculum adriaticum TaxID=413713 RepID=A0A5S5DLY5_9FLAO|nr:hypothetical protein [Tenacibaculum adriaticum]TYP96056.1 hypothetical protein C7447_11015 [Tenacibaculum adriaticum]
MNIENLQIDEALKLRLNSLLNEFESYRGYNKEILTGPVKIDKVESTSIMEEGKAEKAINKFLNKFFFSEFDMAS